MSAARRAEIYALLDAGLPIPTPSGICAVCLRTVRLRMDGTIGRHDNWLYECGGTGHEPTDAETRDAQLPACRVSSPRRQDPGVRVLP